MIIKHILLIAFLLINLYLSNAQNLDTLINKSRYTDSAKNTQNNFPLKQIKIIVPHNKEEFEAIMNQYTNGEITSPLELVDFDTLQIIVPDTANLKYISALETYRRYPPFGQPDLAKIQYFREINDTIYILTNADIDGWAGVSFYLDKIHLLIELSLKQFPDVKAIIWRKK